MSYYVDMEGKTAGPFTIDELAELYTSNLLQESSLYARPGSQEWLPLRTIMPLIIATNYPRGGVAAPPVIPAPVYQRPSARSGDVVCGNCGCVNQTIRVVPGNFLIELVLWFFFLIPGLIYSLWRMSSKRTVCRSCGASNIMAASSPRGRQMVRLEPEPENWSAAFGRWCGQQLFAKRKSR